MFMKIYALALSTTAAFATSTTYYAQCRLQSDTSTLILKQDSDSEFITYDIELRGGSWPRDYLYVDTYDTSEQGFYSVPRCE